jgi:arylsulfatase A-like enzyme
MNVIQIVSDTFRRDHLGCYGNDWIHTENLDSLAEDSVVFDKAYIGSFPTIPHRTDLFTGKYNFLRSGFRPLPTDEIVIAQLLKQSGYMTMLIVDTYHMVLNYFYRDFDGWWWIRGQETDRYMTNPTKDSNNLGDVLGHQYMRNVQTRKFENDYFVAQTMKSAVQWLELNYDKHENFFLHIDTFDPHEPWDPPKWYSDLYDPQWKGGEVIGGAYISDYSTNSPIFQRLEKNLTKNELKQLKAKYAGEVTLLDRWVGTLLEKIEDMGLFENTAVIFTSDHGTFLGEHGYIGKNGHLYEEVCHIPLIIRMPDSENIKPKRCEALVQPPDIMPTILDLANQKIPKIVEGESLLPLINGEDEGKREVTVSSGSLIPEKGGYKNTRRLTITSKEWVLIATIPDLSETDVLGRKIKPELYNLKKDPTQIINLFGEEQEIAKKLHSKMIRFLKSKNTSEEIVKIWKSFRFLEN